MITSSQTQLKHFLPICKLGQGSFSTVYKVKRISDGEIYALKKIKIQQLNIKQKQNSLNQIRILASIKSNFIITYKQAFYDQSLNLLCIVMQYANNGDLQKRIIDHQKNNTKFSQDQIWKAAAQILIGLFILHEKGILHRDLKSANVFITDNVYKLGDLNVSKVNQSKDQMAKTQTGTPYYASPEVWRDQLYNSKCDIWSYGCLIYQMCKLQPPFQGGDLDDLYKKVQRGKFQSIPPIYSQQLALLIQKCLTVNLRERPNTKCLFQQFPKLQWKFMQSYEKNELQISSNLLNTIKLPFDLKDLTKSLPVAQYNSVKQIQKTSYANKQTKSHQLNLKNDTTTKLYAQIKLTKQQMIQKKQLNNVSSKIKQHLSQIERKVIKRPERPSSSQNQRDPRRIKTLTKQDRPLSANYIKLNQEFPNHKIVNNKIRRVVTTVQQDNINDRSYLIEKMIKRKLPPSIPINKKLINGQKKYRCNSSSNSLNNSIKKRCASASIKKTKNIKQQNQQNINNTQKNKIAKPYLDINSLQKIQFDKCKQNSLKKIDSLQKKAMYIRDHRKQRKYMLQQNKQNLQNHMKYNNQKAQINSSAVIDIKNQLRQRIKQNSQIVKNKSIQYTKPETQKYALKAIGDHLSNIRNRLEVRKQKFNYNRRNIVSADNQRHLSLIQKHQRVKNISMTIQNDKHRKVGMIRKVPSQRFPSITNNKSMIQKMIHENSIEYGKLKHKNQYPNDKSDLLLDSEAIMRLKKRINNRIKTSENIRDIQNMKRLK